MYIEQDTADHDAFIWMVKNAVVPRPIAWVSTTSGTGVGNLAPYSYFNLVTMDPPTLMISFIGQKDTYDNIRDVGEFVVNLITDGQAPVATDSAALVEASVDEARLLGLETVRSTVVGPPRLAAARVAMECKYLDEKYLLGANVVFGQVVGIHVDEGILGPDGRIDPISYRPVGRLGGSSYTTVTSEYRHPVPVASAEWLDRQVGGSAVVLAAADPS
jgi:flavin reductase (DIM6/NTAB) family NADH-FMN oxidoreductase RutF